MCICVRAHARAHTYTHTLHSYTPSYTLTHTYAQTHTLRRAPALKSRRVSLTFGASQRAGRAGRGAGGGEIDNRFGGLQGISLLEPKPHKPNPIPARRPRGKSTSSQNHGQQRVEATGLLNSGLLRCRLGVSQGDRPESRRELHLPWTPLHLPGNTSVFFPLQSVAAPQISDFKELTANSLRNTSTLECKTSDRVSLGEIRSRKRRGRRTFGKLPQQG